MDSSKIIKQLKNPEGSGRYSFYLKKAIYDQFKAACQGVPASKVISELMKQFIEGSKKPTKK